MIFATAKLKKYRIINCCELLLFLEIMIFATALTVVKNLMACCELLLFLEIMIFATAYPDLIHWLSI